MWPGIKWRKCLFNLRHAAHHLHGMMAEREVDGD
jgi:hypothetical protein